MIFALNEELVFPPIDLSEPDGLLCFGGDLSPERLLLAYESGIFPWDDNPIIWYAPDPRMILDIGTWQPSKSLKRLIKKGDFKYSIDTAFSQVIQACADARQSTWISPEFIENYTELHHRGFAHSIEVWQEEKLVGGLYGISLGSAFFGESMFHTVSNASKLAFAHLIKVLRQKEITLLDCQVNNDHLVSLGAYDITREEYMNQLNNALKLPNQLGPWHIK